ncbi:MAG: type II toxin-antitoxin system HicB family antitoxin [Candidatus Coatesbacteria bacterium]|nr:MAG: type II toxin-antitoxin system HicB family antitoxin [Candidatus Coatesbacteria bacterium]
MKIFHYRVVVWKERGACVSKCPELGVSSCGGSITEAKENLKQAAGLYLENAEALGLF